MVNEYYVSPEGNDSNPGTIDKPFKSIQTAINSTAGEGRTINLRGGTYDVTEGSYKSGDSYAGIHIEGDWNGGSADEPLKIQAYKDERPVLDGSNVNAGITSVFLKDVENVDIIGLEIHSTKSHGLEVVNGKNINIVNNISRDNQGSGIGVRGYLSDIEENGSTAQRSENVRIEGNKIYRNMLNNSGDRKGLDNWGGALYARHTKDVTIANNEVYENYGEGVIVLQTTDATVDSNTVYDNFSVNLYLDNASRSTVTNNFVYTTGNEEFFRPDGAGNAYPANNINLSNEQYSNVENPELYYQANNTISNNVLAGGGTGIYYGTYAGIHSDASESKRGLKNVRVVNNTIYNPQFSFVKIDEDPGIQNVEFSNNIFSRPDREGWITDIDSNQGLTFSHNLWHGGSQFGGTAGAEGIKSDTDVTADPQLVNPGGNTIEDYQIKRDSAAIDAAKPIDGISNNIDSAPDIGAFEYAATTAQPPETISPPPGKDGGERPTIRLEAEDLQLNGYRRETTKNSGASGEEYISLRKVGDRGTASGVFDGEAGTYQVSVGYYDEKDGNGTAEITIDGNTQSFVLDENLPKGWAQPETLTSRVTHDAIALTPGAQFTIQGTRDKGEFTRFDYIEFTPTEDSKTPVDVPDAPPQVPSNSEGIGTNLAGIADWSTQYPFVDFFKSARDWVTGWRGSGAQPIWDTKESDKLELDEDGWITAVPETGVQFNRATTILANAPVFDRYVVEYEGNGQLEYWGNTTRRDEAASSPGRDVIVATGTDPILLSVLQSDPEGSGDYLRNIRVVPEPFADLPKSTLFNPDFIAHLKGFKTLRFMDWMETNNSDQGEWKDRPKATDANFAKDGGVPVEVMVALANETGIDPWFNMPHKATDEYVREFAKYVKENLDPELKAYVEYSNEVWNAQFEQFDYATEQGKALFGESNTPRIDYFAQRSSEIGMIWDQVFGDEKGRSVGVLASQSANPWVAEQALEYLQEQGMSLADAGIDKLAIAPYFGGAVGAPANEGVLKRWLEDADGGLDKLFTELREGQLLPESAAGGVMKSFEKKLQENIAIAQQAGLELIAYEGGQHIVGRGPTRENEAITDLFIKANADPRMGELYKQYFDIWEANGGGLFANFSDVKTPSKYGSWGAKENLYQEGSPKWDALQESLPLSAMQLPEAQLSRDTQLVSSPLELTEAAASNANSDDSATPDTSSGDELSQDVKKTDMSVDNSTEEKRMENATETASKKMIELGWDAPDAQYFRENIEKIEDSPFEGVTVRLTFDGGASKEDVFKKQAYDESTFEQDRLDLAAVKSEKLTDNFLRINSATDEGWDWFNDSDWAAMEENIRNFAKTAAAGDFKGFLFDPEPYGISPWRMDAETRDKSKSFAEYESLVRERGRQFMSAVQSELPDATIISLFGMREILNEDYYPDSQVDGDKADLAQGEYALLASFIDGWMDAANPTAKIIDGNELSYYYQEDGAYDYNRKLAYEAADYLSPENRERYKADKPVAMATYVDHALDLYPAPGEVGHEPDFYQKRQPHFFDSDEQRLKFLEHNVYHSLRTTDEYVWVYSQQMDWWEGDIPEGAREAVERAKEKIANGEPLEFSVDDAGTPLRYENGKAVIESMADDFIVDVAAIADDATTEKDTAVNIDVLANDGYKNAKGFKIIDAPDNGSAVIDDNGTPDNFRDDTIAYTPNEGFTGEDFLLYEVFNDNGNNWARVEIDVAEEVDPVVEPLPIPEPGEFMRVEAESLQLNGYRRETVNNSGASGDEYISLRQMGDVGTASGIFNGKAGLYEVSVGYYDEKDGKATAEVTVDGSQQSFVLDENLPLGWAQPETLTSRVTHDAIALTSGAQFDIKGTRDKGEFARIDYIDFTPIAPTDALIQEFATASADSKLDGNSLQETLVQGSAGKLPGQLSGPLSGQQLHSEDLLGTSGKTFADCVASVDVTAQG